MCVVWAAREAIETDRLDMLRYLLSRPIAGRPVDHANDEALIKAAIYAGNVDAVTYLHDRMPSTSQYPCSCSPDVGLDAWCCGTVAVIEWLKQHGCKGYVPPTASTLASAIWGCVKDDVARHMIGMLPAGRDGAHLERVTLGAAQLGRIGVVSAIVDADLCADPTPILLGAASGDRVHILSWLVAPACASLLGMPSRAAVRAAALRAADAGATEAMAWLLDRYGDVIDADMVLYAAIRSGSVGVVRMFSSHPFDWQRALPTALASWSLRLVQFLVEEKGVAVDAHAVATAPRICESIMSFACARLDPTQRQEAFDLACALSLANDEGEPLARLRAAMPDVCVAAWALHSRLCEDEDRATTETACRCASCALAPAPFVGIATGKRPRDDDDTHASSESPSARVWRSGGRGARGRRRGALERRLKKSKTTTMPEANVMLGNG